MSFQYIPFGGTPRKESRPSNRRASVRYQCALATPSRLVLADRTEYRRAWVVDLSPEGVGLVLAKPLTKGQNLVIQIKNPTTSKVVDLPAEVKHCTLQPGGDYHVGCAFVTPLSADQVDGLL